MANGKKEESPKVNNKALKAAEASYQKEKQIKDQIFDVLAFNP